MKLVNIREKLLLEVKTLEGRVEELIKNEITLVDNVNSLVQETSNKRILLNDVSVNY